MSDIVLSGTTALAAYQSIREWRGSITPAVFRKSCRVPTLEEIDYFMQDDSINTKYLEVLLPDQHNRDAKIPVAQKVFSSSKHGIVVSVAYNNPFGSVDSFLLVSPAFLIAQLAHSTDFLSLLTLAMELGSTFATSSQKSGFLSDCIPVLDPHSLKRMVKKLEPTK